LAQRTGSDGYEWEVGVEVTTVSPAISPRSPATGRPRRDWTGDFGCSWSPTAFLTLIGVLGLFCTPISDWAEKGLPRSARSSGR